MQRKRKGGPAPDEVLSRDRKSGKLEFQRVTGLIKPHSSKLLGIRIAGEAHALRPTREHPFFVKMNSGGGNWVRASQLLVGDSVLTKKGAWKKVIAISQIDETQVVYNFEVAQDHDYFAGKSGFLVHNTFCLGKTQGLSDFASEIGGETYQTLDLPDNLQSVANIIESGEDIAVQLEESPNVVAAELENVVSGNTSGLASSPFEQELQYIADNPSTWGRITWYMGNTVVDNPFAY